VDIIVRSPKYVIPVEVKYRGSPSFGPNEGLVRFCASNDVERAYWVTERQEDFGLLDFPGISTRFLRVPAHIFCWLLGQAERLLWEERGT